MDEYFARLFGLFVVAMGAWAISVGRKNVALAQQARGWPTAEATIVASEVRKRPGANTRFRLKIRYRYVVDGREFTGKNIAVGGEIRSGRTLAEKRQQKYPEGSTHPVYYNPENPGEACLEPVVEGGGRIEWLGGLAGIVIGIVIIAVG